MSHKQQVSKIKYSSLGRAISTPIIIGYYNYNNSKEERKRKIFNIIKPHSGEKCRGVKCNNKIVYRRINILIIHNAIRCAIERKTTKPITIIIMCSNAA